MQIITENLSEDKSITLTGYIQMPSNEMANKSEKPAILVLPGGGYLFTSDREAEPIALAYASKGFQTFVLRYSVGAKAVKNKPLSEASEAIGLIRKNAEKWHVKKDRILTCGFSAGGHLSAWVSLCGEHKPNGMILCYPALELHSPEIEKAWDLRGEPNMVVQALLGENYGEDEAEALNLAKYIKPNPIPMFCWSTSEDTITMASPILNFIKTYADAGGHFELHMYQRGVHGLSLANHLTASGNDLLIEPQAEGWVDLSVNWFEQVFK